MGWGGLSGQGKGWHLGAGNERRTPVESQPEREASVLQPQGAEFCHKPGNVEEDQSLR